MLGTFSTYLQLGGGASGPPQASEPRGPARRGGPAPGVTVPPLSARRRRSAHAFLNPVVMCE